jgi:hypothetical protein
MSWDRSRCCRSRHPRTDGQQGRRLGPRRAGWHSRWRLPTRQSEIRRGSSRPGSWPSMRSSGPAACPAGWASRSGATSRVAGRRSPCGSSRRPRPRARSWPGWTSRRLSIRWRPSLAASGRNGSWSSRRATPTRASRSPARCSRAGPWTSSSSTSRRASKAPRASPTASAGSRRWPGGPGSASWSWSRRASSRPSPLPSARRRESVSSWPVDRGSASGATSSASERR